MVRSGIDFSVKGIPQLALFIKSKTKDTQKNVKTGLTLAAIYVQGEVKSSIAGQRDETQSVDTGRFLNSVDINILEDSASIFSLVPYAKFLEYGTSRFIGRKHFENTKARTKDKVVEIITREVKKM